VAGSLRVLEGPCDFLSVFSVLTDVLGRMFDYFELCDSRYIESHALLQDVSQMCSVSCALQWGSSQRPQQPVACADFPEGRSGSVAVNTITFTRVL